MTVSAVVTSTTVDSGSELPDIPGFVLSVFSPLVNEAARRCLADPRVGEVAGPRTALLLGSVYGDSTTSDTASRNLVAGDVRNPLLFYQSVPTTVLGNIARDHGITGPTISLSATGDPRHELRETAELLFLTDEVDAALLITVELAANPRTARLSHTGDTDVATAVFLRKGESTC
ncbi:hypothetical protein ACFP1Z_01980 [Streptomyces gamaensis]|uniref:Beta-ketoacyl synthase N-terminal domain-containing protein n=1 Tax=Streptomyces gamaensis TaxID=1763542 RepID=A0ABW0YQX4_9ACTN